MDNNSIATLMDLESSIKKSFKKIKKKFDEYELADNSQKESKLNGLKQELSNAKTNIGLIKMEISNLNEESNINRWNDKIDEIQQKHDEYKGMIDDLKKRGYKNNDEEEQLDINVQVDPKNLTSQQAMDRGDKILKEDKEAFSRMKKVVSSDIDTMKEVNKELVRQDEVLDNANNDLKEIDFSIKRAGQQVKTMFKMYATDKLIMCMIVVILLIILTIIIVAAVGEDKDNNFNVPHDIFSNSNSNTNNTSG